MATLHLLCGLPGSGKTTLAKRLEATGAVRLCPDEWLVRLLSGDESPSALDRMRYGIEQAHLVLTERLLGLGLDVVLEFGFWSRAERDHARQVGREAGAQVALYALAAPIEVLWSRIEARQDGETPRALTVSRAELDLWANQIETPGEDEAALFDRTSGDVDQLSEP